MYNIQTYVNFHNQCEGIYNLILQIKERDLSLHKLVIIVFVNYTFKNSTIFFKRKIFQCFIQMQKTCDIKLFALEQTSAFVAKTLLLLHWELEGGKFQISFCKVKDMNT